jgi:ankyrin repeat protein
LSNLQKQHQCGADLFEGDYDARNALHLAATEGHGTCLQFLIDCMPADKKAELINKQDRWYGTPLDDAEQHDHQSCIKLLKCAGALNGHRAKVDKELLPPAATRKATPSEDGPDLISAASRGDLDRLIKLNARGIDLSFDHHDYDLRTPLHLAASIGHLHCVKYLVLQAQKMKQSKHMVDAVDRWGNTALADATREKHKECEAFLRSLDFIGIENAL